MRWTLISFIVFAFFTNAIGQEHSKENVFVSKSPINIGLDEVHKIFVPANSDRALKSATAGSCRMNVTFVNFPEEAKAAFTYAVSIWEKKIASPVSINIFARFENIDGNVIANGRPSAFHKNFTEAPLPDVYYPVALAEKLTGREMNSEKAADIEIYFNKLKPWYFGTDGNTPATDYDFVTVALHEIAHGLGISGFFEDVNNLGQYSNPTNTPSVYDFYVFNLKEERLADQNIFRCPSAELHREFTSNNLKFNVLSANNSGSPKIYAPEKWNPGASIYHLNANIGAGENELMSPFTCKGQAIHNPGEKTLHILSELGWNAATVKFDEIRDIEDPCEKLQVKTGFETDNDFEAVQLVYSKDYFKTADSIRLSYNNREKVFEGELPLGFYTGKVQYYFAAKANGNQTLTYPNRAPEKVLTFKIGPDYYPPAISHNPVKLVSNNHPEIDFTVLATDNLGINSVTVEYKINGVDHEPMVLTCESEEIYQGKLTIPTKLNPADRIEYRIVAEDNSVRKNKKQLPSNGYFQVQVFEALEPVKGYETDFDAVSNDFVFNDFDIDVPSGFSNGTLHTANPYPQSEIRNEKYNLLALLKYPVILEENGQMTFDEVVLVEPGEHGTRFTDDIFWDYVIVEGSKDKGKTWLPFTDGYDSGINESWETQFSNTLKSNMSGAAAHENMFWEHTIHLTENGNFSAGDTVLIRFRLAADNSVNGWGWAIDNLQIQKINTINDEMMASEDMKVYPNPCSNNLFIEWAKLKDQAAVDVQITDLTGKTVFRETNFDVYYSPKMRLDLSGLQPGIYLASITDNNYNTITKRIIKN